MRRYVTGNKVIEKRGRGLKIIGWDSRQKKADAATPPAHQTSHASNAAGPKTARLQFFYISCISSGISWGFKIPGTVI